MKQDLLDLSIQELEAVFADWGQPRYRARQVIEWVYNKLITNFSEMTNLPAALRERLSLAFEVCRPSVVKTLTSRSDGASKQAVRLHDGHVVESVIIPTEKRLTHCVSTQVGCKFGCAFCASGASGFKRSLSSGEILSQVLLAAKSAAPRRLSHIVVMGMGEPLDNLENTIKAIRMINSELGFNIGWRRITVSTVGIPNEVEDLVRQLPQVGLSFSLHAATDKLRDKIVPVNQAFPIASILEAAQRYFEATGRLPTFEYVLIEGLNSAPEHARALARLLRTVRCKVNLIPFNTTSDPEFMPPPPGKAQLFLAALEKAGLKATIRHSKGGDISAACGQLAMASSESEVTGRE